MVKMKFYDFGMSVLSFSANNLKLLMVPLSKRLLVVNPGSANVNLLLVIKLLSSSYAVLITV